ncbi:hypothetical protein [Paracoccus tegillarcae]|uniref:Uncharacterized protein n=1 Tax=Paracoccus tegillarcae TaxID=1529068 RepID=A0A2K9ECK8_9RHOB|nr:hypothetical protein [Paracoccus tegillarcae]AUH32658.1 hypothetical protein CUV01_04015 [Paracoccus tegillarcae]
MPTIVITAALALSAGTSASAQSDLAVYSHMVLMGNPPIAELISRTRSTDDGPLVIGRDLMQFMLSDNGTTLVEAGH